MTPSEYRKIREEELQKYPPKMLRAYAKSIGALVTTGNLITPIINREIKRGKK